MEYAVIWLSYRFIIYINILIIINELSFNSLLILNSNYKI